MQTQEKSPFIQRLENGTETKMLLLSHNASWTRLQMLERRYENFELEVFGQGTTYINMRLRKKGYILPDVDFIVFYSSSYYDPDELEYLKKLAKQYSIDGQKRVTVGYSFVVPEEKRSSKDITDAIVMSSIKNGSEDGGALLDAPEEMYFTPLALTDIVTEFHENFEKSLKEEKTKEELTEENLSQIDNHSLKKVFPSKND